MRQIVKTSKAPSALGPYSQAVKARAGEFVFCSGQCALDPKDGAVVGQTAEVQCKQAMTNLAAVLEEAGSDMSKVVKTTLYLADMNDFAVINEVYGTFFGEEPPARSTVEVSRLPKDVKFEIDAIALV